MFDINTIPDELKGYSGGNKIFQFYRIVDPQSHTVYNDLEHKLVKSEDKCYDVWKRGGPCANCISKEVCDNNSMFIKMEQLGNSVFIIYSVPIEFDGRIYSLELIREATDYLFVGEQFEKNTKLINLVNRFNDLLTRDPFTELYNKSYITNRIESFISGDAPGIKTYIGALFDINNFKVVNDLHGHYMGDKVIKGTADIFKSICKDTDKMWAARLGGDEFFLAFIDYDMKDALKVCNNVSAEISAKEYTKNSEVFSVQAAFGIDAVDKEADTMESFIDRIDKKLYENKAHMKIKSHKK